MVSYALPNPRIQGKQEQPVNRVEWVHRDTLHANSYNPNIVAPIEMHLLKISLLEDGWTQPIVVREDMEIVDGYHRWTCSADPAVYAMTEGFVPVVRLTGIDKDHQIMSTIRHNRATGTHAVLRMADIVRDLIDEEGCSTDEVKDRLQMDDEEVERLYDRGGIRKKAALDDFNKGWVPGEMRSDRIQ